MADGGGGSGGRKPSRFSGAVGTFRSKLLPWWLYGFVAAFLVVGAVAVLADAEDETPVVIPLFMLLLAAVSILFAVLGRQTQQARRDLAD